MAIEGKWSVHYEYNEEGSNVKLTVEEGNH